MAEAIEAPKVQQSVTESREPGSPLAVRVDRSGAARQVDMATRVAAERLALRAMHGVCGFLAVSGLAALEVALHGTWADALKIWFVFLPLMAALMPVRGYAGFANPHVAGILRAISALINAVAVVLGLQILIVLSGQAFMEGLFLLLLVLLHSAFCLTGRTFLERRVHRQDRKIRLVIIGAGEQGIATARDMAANEPDVEVIGFVDDRQTRIDCAALPAPLLGRATDLAWRSHEADGVVIALPAGANERINALMAMLRDGCGSVYLASELPVLQQPLARRANTAPHNLRLLGMSSLPLEGRILKRAFDIVFSALMLAAFLPVGMLIAVLIRIESPGPVFFRQKRHGLGNRLFDVYKFRSMVHVPVAPDQNIRLTERGDSRVTRIGALLRRSSVDEFPQFLNVLAGQMSVVGPRPHPPGVKAGERTYEEVVDAFAERYKVSPGITGWAQVNGLRGNTFTERHLTERFAYDIEYIQNWSFELDLWIVLRTAFGGFGGRNAF